jgi:hypothetical protein
MLDLKLTLRDMSGNTIAVADTASLGETLSASVAAGFYAIVVASHGSYGDVGQYTLSGTVQPGGPVADTSPTVAAAPVAAVSAAASTIEPALVVKPASHGRVELQWTYPARKARGFLIERSRDGVTWTKIRTVSKKTRKFVEKQVAAGNFDYRVMAVLKSGT